MNYLEELKIEVDNLEQMCAEQPQKYMRVAEECAQAELDRDRAKQSLTVAKATVEQVIRSSKPAQYGLDKFTESSIQALMAKNPEVQQAEEEYLKACNTYTLTRSAREAFQDRSRQLTNLVQMTVHLMYSDPEQSRRVKEQIEKQLNQP